ncbi:MAG: putative quinol monooxygenase [Hyphomonadaceae bacterium]
MIMVIAGIARFPAHRKEELVAPLREMVAATRAEPGNIVYSISFDPFEEGVLRIYEEYKDRDAIKAHIASPHMKAWRAHSADFTRELKIYEAEEAAL